VQNSTFTPIIKHLTYRVDEYGPELHYVKGSANVVADTFSPLARKDTPPPPAVGKKRPAAIISNPESDVEDTPLDNYFSWTDGQEMLQCFTCLPMKNVTLTFLVISLQILHWTSKTSTKNKTLMMHSNIRQKSTQIAFCDDELVRSTISYAMLSQEILQTIGK
jgi:hypothetical protein